MSRFAPKGFAFSAVMVFAAVTSGAAVAADTVVQGEGRGSAFRTRCDGGYVTGLQGRAGGWIDRFSIACSAWDANARRIVSTGVSPQVVGQSQGGGPSSASCPDGYLLKGISFRDAKGDGPTPVVHSINLKCVSLFGSDKIVRPFGSTANENNGGVFGGTRFAGLYDADCPGNEVATGFIGRYGSFVDALGLQCGAPPDTRIATAPVPQPNQPPPAPVNTRPTPPQAIPGDPFTGTWNTFTDKNWSYRMVLVQQGRSVTGQYVAQNGDRGEINGRVGASVMEFTWTQAGGFSGTGQFALGPDGNSFSGIYRSNPHPQLTDPRFLQGSWSGTRQ